MNPASVSVCIITYNQRDYIEECLESVLAQKCNFNWDIILNDDNSTDGTSEICHRIALNSGGRISYQHNQANLGMIGNWVDCIRRSEGKYVAICEGDDYWTDRNKLQKQFDMLEAHPQYSGCFHNTEERYEDSETLASFLYCNYPSARTISFEDMGKGNLMPTCSVMFRNKLFGEFPEWYYKLKLADWSLHLLNAQYGNFAYIPKVMGVHRLHSQSVWMLQDSSVNNKYVLNAYDTFIDAFSHNSTYCDSLRRGKEAFARLMEGEPLRKPGYFQRAKQLVKKVLNK